MHLSEWIAKQGQGGMVKLEMLLRTTNNRMFWRTWHIKEEE